MTVTRITPRSIKNQLMLVWDIVMHVDLSLATEVINMFLNVLSAKTIYSVSPVVDGQNTYMPIILIILSLTLLRSTLILFISHETLNEYVVEGDDKLKMDFGQCT